jgi:hypothetical protein
MLMQERRRCRRYFCIAALPQKYKYSAQAACCG